MSVHFEAQSESKNGSKIAAYGVPVWLLVCLVYRFIRKLFQNVENVPRNWYTLLRQILKHHCAITPRALEPRPIVALSKKLGRLKITKSLEVEERLTKITVADFSYQMAPVVYYEEKC